MCNIAIAAADEKCVHKAYPGNNYTVPNVYNTKLDISIYFPFGKNKIYVSKLFVRKDRRNGDQSGRFAWERYMRTGAKIV